VRDLGLNNKLPLHSIRDMRSMIKKSIFLLSTSIHYSVQVKNKQWRLKIYFYLNQCLQQPSFLNKSQKRILAKDAKATVTVVYNWVAIKQLCHSFLFVKIYFEHFYKILSGKYGKEFMKRYLEIAYTFLRKIHSITNYLFIDYHQNEHYFLILAMKSIFWNN